MLLLLLITNATAKVSQYEHITRVHRGCIIYTYMFRRQCRDGNRGTGNSKYQ